MLSLQAEGDYNGRQLGWQRLLWQSATVTVLAIPNSFVPGSAPGCRIGNREKLSSTQAEPVLAIKSGVAYFPSISCTTSWRRSRYKVENPTTDPDSGSESQHLHSCYDPSFYWIQIWIMNYKKAENPTPDSDSDPGPESWHLWIQPSRGEQRAAAAASELLAGVKNSGKTSEGQRVVLAAISSDEVDGNSMPLFLSIGRLPVFIITE